MWMIPKDHDRNQEATVWVGNLESQCTEELVWELFVQAGPVVDVTMPRDKITTQHRGYAFVEFKTPEDADYCIRILNMIKMFGKHIKVNKAAKDQGESEDQFSANLFVRNLHPDVDNKFLYDTFSAFGCVLSAKVMTEDDSAASKGFAFVSFDTFDASDAAIKAMDGQYLMNRTIHVSYAYKKDGTKGERHGDRAERMLAAKRKQNAVSAAAVQRAFPQQAALMFRPTLPTMSFRPSLPAFNPRPAMRAPPLPPNPFGAMRPPLRPQAAPRPPRPVMPPKPPPGMPRPPMPPMPPKMPQPPRPPMPPSRPPMRPPGLPPRPPGMGMGPRPGGMPGVPPRPRMPMNRPPGMPGMMPPGMMPPHMMMGNRPMPMFMRPPMMPPNMMRPPMRPPGMPMRPPNL